MDDIPDQIVASDPIPATPAGQSVVGQFVHNMTAKCTVGVLRPDGHAETTAEAHAEQGGPGCGNQESWEVQRAMHQPQGCD